jgi:hypothetical protein
MTTAQGGERLVLAGTCALAVTIAEVPELSPGTIERQHLCEVQMLTVCAPSHPLAAMAGPVPREEFGRHIQLVVTDNQPDAEKTQQGVAGERQWRVNDLGAKHDLLRGGLCWGHMPRHMVAEDLANGTLVELRRRAWHMRPLTFMLSQRRGYSLSECETRLVELLGNLRRLPKDTSRRSVSRKGKKNTEGPPCVSNSQYGLPLLDGCRRNAARCPRQSNTAAEYRINRNESQHKSEWYRGRHRTLSEVLGNWDGSQPHSVSNSLFLPRKYILIPFEGPIRPPFGVAVEEQFRTSSDAKTAEVTGVCRSIQRLVGW